MYLTICTPTYNRAYCLPDLYRSLQKQTNKNFEWVVVDDGSSDNTKSLVEAWAAEEQNFTVRYFYKENGGKHTALNCGVKNARGECFIIVDSDDMLTSDAVSCILDAFTDLPREGFAGVGFNRLFVTGELIGSTFSGNSVDASTLERPRFNIRGDKAEVFRTEILCKFPFPVFGKERFLPEALVWNRIAAAGYKLRWYNKGIYLCEYRLDGLTVNASFLESFQGYSLYVKEILEYKETCFVEKVRAIGVYAWNAEKKGLSVKQIASEMNVVPLFVLCSKSLYKLKKGISLGNRKRKLRINR